METIKESLRYPSLINENANIIFNTLYINNYKNCCKLSTDSTNSEMLNYIKKQLTDRTKQAYEIYNNIYSKINELKKEDDKCCSKRKLKGETTPKIRFRNSDSESNGRSLDRAPIENITLMFNKIKKSPHNRVILDYLKNQPDSNKFKLFKTENPDIEADLLKYIQSISNRGVYGGKKSKRRRAKNSKTKKRV